MNENIKYVYSFSLLEHDEYFGLGLLKIFVFAFSAPPLSMGGALHVAYVTNQNCLVLSRSESDVYAA